METNLSLKEQKELFVTGHDGTSPWELLFVCSAAPIGMWLYQSLRALDSYTQDKNSNNKSSTVTTIIVEALVLWWPFLICQTNLLYPWGVIWLGFEVQLSLFVFLYFWTTRRWMRIRNMQQPSSPPPEPDDSSNDFVARSIMRESMTVYRSSMLYLTFVAILAVDFHVFPRRFAKTETAGYGLMDLGAGSFMVAAGLVSSRARRPSSAPQTVSFGKKDILRVAPLLLIGFIRLATNKGLEYQEHVSEYGVHWNFFFTLACITPLGSMLPGIPNWIVPTVLLVAYQTYLTLYGGQEFIETAPRTHCNPQVLADLVGDNATLQQVCTLFVANREGVLGCIGYLSLYLFSEYIAYAFLWTNRKNSTAFLWIIAGVLWTLLYGLVESLGIVVSRRSTNASFCTWTLAHSMVLLAGIHSAISFYENSSWTQQSSQTMSRPRVPVVFQAVNRHGLLAFLIANLLTGLTNIAINTLAVSDTVALLILFLYLTAVGGASLLLHFVMESKGILYGKGTSSSAEKSKTE